MVKENYLDSDDIEVATLYANIIYQEKGKEYLIEVLKSSDYTFNVINEVVTVFPTTSYSLVNLKDLIKK